MNIAPKVAVLLALATATFTAGLTIKVNPSLESWKPAIPALWTISACLGLLAIYLAFFHTTDEERRSAIATRKAELRNTMRDLKREYRKTNHVASQFILGAEYYIQRTSLADAGLIHEIIEEEGEKE